MANFNLVPGGPRLHNKSRLSGPQLANYLIRNSSLFESTSILEVPGLPENILEMSTLHAVQIAKYVGISVIDMNKLTLKQFHKWFAHICAEKVVKEGRSIEKALLGCGKVCSQCGARSANALKRTSVKFGILDEK
eukprot:scaffold174925_cov30-Cyclotella_meneghiniana.AAC.1